MRATMAANTSVKEDPKGASMTLIGAPDNDIGSRSAEKKTRQAFQIELSPAEAEELRHCARMGQNISLLCGKDPALRYGDTSKRVLVSSLPGRQELYRTVDDDKATSSSAEFVALLTHHVAIAENPDAMASTALQKMQATMAEKAKEKDGNKIQHIQMKELEQVRSKKRRKVGPTNIFGTKSAIRTPQLSSNNRPTAESPLPLSNKSTNETLAQIQVQRCPLVHYLAIGERSFIDITEATNINAEECKALLNKIGEQAKDSGNWTLKDRYFKELLPWRFPYKTEQDRQAAIANAVNALDRQRISREEPVWELLNPPHQRGRGICLSRLLDLRAGPRTTRPTQLQTHSAQNTPPIHHNPSPFYHQSSATHSADEMPATTRSTKAKREHKEDEAEVQSKADVKKTAAEVAPEQRTKPVPTPHIKENGKGSNDHEQIQKEGAAKSKATTVQPKPKIVTSASNPDIVAGKKRKSNETDTSAAVSDYANNAIAPSRSETKISRLKITARSDKAVGKKRKQENPDDGYVKKIKTTPSSDSSVLSAPPRTPLTPPSLQHSPPKDHVAADVRTNGAMGMAEASIKGPSPHKISKFHSKSPNNVESPSITAEETAQTPPAPGPVFPPPAVPYTTTDPDTLVVFKAYQKAHVEYVVSRCAAEMALATTRDVNEHDEIELNAAEKYDDFRAITAKIKTIDPRFDARRAYDTAALRDALSRDAKLWMKAKLREYCEENTKLFRELQARAESTTAEERRKAWDRWFEVDHFKAMVKDVFRFESGI